VKKQKNKKKTVMNKSPQRLCNQWLKVRQKPEAGKCTSTSLSTIQKHK
jgi:hypothetical protein